MRAKSWQFSKKRLRDSDMKNAPPKILRASIKNVTFGAGCTVVEPANLYECEIGASTFVGPFVEIQKKL